MNKFLYLLVTGALMVAASSPKGIAANIPHQPLVFTTPTDEGVFTQYQKDVFKKIYERTGIKCALKELPKKRCLVAADKGLYAGVAARIKGLEKEYPNLRMIGVSHFTVQHILFAKKKEIIETVKDIKTFATYAVKTHCIVGYLRGSKKAQSLLSSLPPQKKVPLDSPQNAFKLLATQRIDAYLAGPGIVNRSILKKEFHYDNIHEVCILAQTRLFPYVHSKYAYLIPVFKTALQSMVDDGTLERIRKSLE